MFCGPYLRPCGRCVASHRSRWYCVKQRICRNPILVSVAVAFEQRLADSRLTQKDSPLSFPPLVQSFFDDFSLRTNSRRRIVNLKDCPADVKSPREGLFSKRILSKKLSVGYEWQRYLSKSPCRKMAFWGSIILSKAVAEQEPRAANGYVVMGPRCTGLFLLERNK